MTTDICVCQEAPEFRNTTWGGPVCSRCGKKMILSRQIGEIRKVIDQFELWKCGEDADGYNVSADRLATIIANQSSGGASLVDGMTDEEFDRDRSDENPDVGRPAPWMPPAAADRPDGFECLIWHRGRWRHVSWVAAHQGWMFGYASAQTMDAPDRLYAPLPVGAPENDFWQGEKS